MVVGWVVGEALLWISSDKDDRRSFWVLLKVSFQG